MKDILSARLESGAFSADAVELYELTGREVISQLFEFQLHIVCKSPEGLDEEALLAEPAALVFLRGDREERRLFGEIAVVRDALLTEASHMAYTLTFVPRAFRMTLTETSEIFMDLSVPEACRTSPRLRRWSGARGAGCGEPHGCCALTGRSRWSGVPAARAGSARWVGSRALAGGFPSGRSGSASPGVG